MGSGRVSGPRLGIAISLPKVEGVIVVRQSDHVAFSGHEMSHDESVQGGAGEATGRSAEVSDAVIVSVRVCVLEANADLDRLVSTLIVLLDRVTWELIAMIPVVNQ